MGIADLAESELEAAILIVSEDVSAGSCVVQFTDNVRIKFESIGRDDDGGFLITDDGATVRLKADAAELDNLLGKDEVMIEELDANGTFIDAYPVTARPFDSSIGFRA